MLRKSVLPIIGCSLLLMSACAESEPPGNDSSTSVSQTAPVAEKSTGETQKEQSSPRKSSKATAGQEPVASNGPGIKVGEKAPAFTLKDQNGKEQALDDLVKQGNVALVFYRSADW